MAMHAITSPALAAASPASSLAGHAARRGARAARVASPAARGISLSSKHAVSGGAAALSTAKGRAGRDTAPRVQHLRSRAAGAAIVASASADGQVNVLVVGGGGREHALAWRLAQAPSCNEVFCIPGNPGISTVPKVSSVTSVKETDHAAVIKFCQENSVELVVVGPEAPLVDGLADSLRAAGVRVFGPSKAAAALEGSKAFLKALLKKYNIPTAEYANFNSSQLDEALDYIKSKGAPIVVKTDGLAAGKGVTVAMDVDTALEAARGMLSGELFGDAGSSIVIEEFLDGEEASYFALCDGESGVPLVSAQDHKRVGEGDTGPNTGGMGAYSPAPVVTPEVEEIVMRDIINPTIQGMKSEGTPYVGVLFAGLMIKQVDGKTQVKLLEHNVRFGDPECQVLMSRLQSDLVQALIKVSDGKAHEVQLEWSDEAAMVVVMAANGYPAAYEKNTPINNIEAASENVAGTYTFHAGTSMKDGQLVATGGRVLGVTAMGKDVKEAQERAYKVVDGIEWADGFCRRDIGWRAIERLGK